MSRQTGPVHDERSALHAFVCEHQAALRTAAAGLGDDDAGTRPTRSGLTVGTLLKHATGMQGRWLRRALAAPDAAATEDPALREAEFTWDASDTLPGVLAEFDAMSGRLLDAVLATDLELPVPYGDLTGSADDVRSVRWVWFHVLEELARHAGHADIIREQLDGETAASLAVSGRA